jgi:superfamily II DNA/RNA helicase
MSELIDSDLYKEFDSFDDVLYEYHDGNLLRGLYAYGFERPSPIQSKTIISMCEGRDTVAQAQSGSGKTAAFGIAALARVDITIKHPQVIIIGNTRELANQIAGVLNDIGTFTGIKICVCVGGNAPPTHNTFDKSDEHKKKHISGPNTFQNYEEAKNSHILVCTPGRLNDLIVKDQNQKKDKLLLKNIKLLILDEADYLLTGDFILQIQMITRSIPKDTQVCLFSATYSEEVIKLSEKIIKDPVKILITNEKVSVESIKNFYVNIHREEYKYGTLVEFYNKISVCQAVIFVNAIEKAEQLGNKLKEAGHTVGIIHSKMDDIDRREILKNFRNTRIRILVATDIIARGIDVQQVGLVINYDIPEKSEQYIHRVGRSGRFGKIGVAISLVTDHYKDIDKMKAIEKNYKINFEELPELDVINNFLTGLNGFSSID